MKKLDIGLNEVKEVYSGPEGVLWENYNTKIKPSWIKRVVSVYIWSFLLICAQAVAMYIVKQRIEDVED